MLPFRKRGNRSGGRPLDSHGSPASSVSPIHHSPRHSGVNKISLRDRFRELKGSITRRGSPGCNGAVISYTPEQCHDMKSNEDLSKLGLADAWHVETAGHTWPAIRQSVGPIASSTRTSRDSVHYDISPDGPSHQSWSCRSRNRLRACQENARRWATIAARVSPMTRRHSSSLIRHASFSTISEVVSRQLYDTVPRLPGLDESNDFLESLSKTGLFRLFTPLSEIDNAAEAIKVQNTAMLDESLTGHARSVVARLPLRLRSPDSLFYKATGYPIYKRIRGQQEDSQAKTPDLSTIYTEKDSPQTDHNGPQQHQTPHHRRKPQISGSSKHPVEWLDRVLETSYCTRNPISPNLCVSKATMEFLRRSNTCIFVEAPQKEKLPAPLRCYPGFRAALEDICDRFGAFYAPFAAYNAHTRMITLYATGTERPVNRFIDEDTALFDLETARSAWARPALDQVLSTNVTETSTSRETSEEEEDRHQTGDSSGSGSGSRDSNNSGEDTQMTTDLEEEEEEGKGELQSESPSEKSEDSESWTMGDPDFEDENDPGENADDKDLASRLGC